MTPFLRIWRTASRMQPSQWRLWYVESRALRFVASRIILSHSAVVTAKGFSLTTPTPARRHSMASAAWVLWGVMMATRSTSDFASISVTDG